MVEVTWVIRSRSIGSSLTGSPRVSILYASVLLSLSVSLLQAYIWRCQRTSIIQSIDTHDRQQSSVKSGGECG
jgi:hypothetical protein